MKTPKREVLIVGIHDRLTSMACLFAMATALFSCGEFKQDSANKLHSLDSLTPPEIVVMKPSIVALDTMPAPTVIPVPKKPGKLTVPNYLNYANDPLPPTLELDQPRSIKGGFSPKIDWITMRDGLPGNEVRQLVSARDGAMWMNIGGVGFVRYDGHRYETISSQIGGIQREDSSGKLWVSGNDFPLAFYKAGEFTIGGESWPTGGVVAMDEDESGGQWVLVYENSKGLLVNKVMKYAGKEFVSVFSDTSRLPGYLRSFAVRRDQSFWIGTSHGLVRVAGSEIEVFGEEQGLVNREVRKIVKGIDGSLWIMTPKGFSNFDGHTFTNYTSKNGLPDHPVNDLLIDGKGNLWIGYAGGGLYKYDGKTFKHFGRDEGLPGLWVTNLEIDNLGLLWFTTEAAGLCRLDPDGVDVFRGYDGLTEDSHVSDHIWISSIHEDHFGNLWFGGSGFAYRYDGTTFQHFSTEQGFLVYGSKGAQVNSIVSDKAGNVWFGMGGGNISIYDGNSFTHYSNAQGSDRYISTLCITPSGRVWAGTVDVGFLEFRGNQIWRYAWGRDYSGQVGVGEVMFWSMVEDHTGALWMTTPKGLRRFDGKTGIHFGAKAGLPDDFATKVYQDKQGNLWCGTAKGLAVIRKSKLQHIDSMVSARPYHNLFEVYTRDEGLAHVIVTHGIAEDSRGNIFLASPGGLTVIKGGLGEPGKGLARNGIEHYSIHTGYPMEDVARIFVDKQDVVWISMAFGVARFDYQHMTAAPSPRRPSINRVQIGDHLVSWRTLERERRGGSLDGQFSSLDSYRVEETSLFGSPMTDSLRKEMIGKFGSIQFDSVAHFVPVNLVLPYQHNEIAFDFGVNVAGRPKMMRYQYMLEGYDDQWSPVTEQTSAKFGNMDEGSYRFLVRSQVQGPTSPWSEPTIYAFRVLPPWYRSWWAYAGYSLLGAGLLVLARRSIVQRERLKSNLKLAKVEQEREHFELEKAKEVDRVKNSFFTNISHEFRTPLTLIKGPVQNILDQYKDEPKIQQQLKLVQRNSDLLLKLINQLLDLAKLESGSLKVEKSAGEVHGFVRAIASGFESHARQKGVTLTVDVSSEPANVMFDRDKLETILINLINNAIKFTPSNGSVTVTANLGVNGQNLIPNTQHLALVVADTGIGIPPNQTSKIFERFHQVSESHKEVGTGIGLALVKELVNLMGGTIKVESEIGKGSTFTVTLPVEPATVAEAEQQTDGQERPTTYHSPLTTYPDVAGRATSSEQRAASNDETEDGSPSKPQVLVVEDNFDVRAFIIDSLGDEFNFLEAENGKQGLEKATSEIPDLIISDVMMPEMDGIEMAARIKEDRNTSHIPLILLTAKSTEESKLSGLSSGADDYLTKPFNKQELLLKVRNSINRQNKLKEMLRGQLLTETPKEKVLSQDEQFLQKVKETIIQQMSNEQLSVESLADDIGMSRVQLYRKVSALTGMAVNELIRKLRLQRAAQLLSQNWGPVSQVAYEVGFSNLSYFSKVFKEEFDVLPSEYETKS